MTRYIPELALLAALLAILAIAGLVAARGSVPAHQPDQAWRDRIDPDGV